jgi:hypothetical protein
MFIMLPDRVVMTDDAELEDKPAEVIGIIVGTKILQKSNINSIKQHFKDLLDVGVVVKGDGI